MARGVTVLADGRWANAVLYLLEHGGHTWVVKDFKPRAFLVRHTIGRLLISREYDALRRMRGIAGVPQDAFRVDGCALAYRFTPGQMLNKADLGPRIEEFFLALESVLMQVHAVAAIVHLDTRTGSNVLVTEQGEPTLIDFQSQMSTAWMPRPMRRWLEGFDMAGIYKHWARLSPETMGESRHKHLQKMNRRRRFWILRGYLGVRKPMSVK